VLGEKLHLGCITHFQSVVSPLRFAQQDDEMLRNIMRTEQLESYKILPNRITWTRIAEQLNKALRPRDGEATSSGSSSSGAAGDSGCRPMLFTSKQCRSRWQDQLRPGIVKGNWSRQERDLIVERAESLDPSCRFRELELLLPHRTAADLKNYYYSLVRGGYIAAPRKGPAQPRPPSRMADTVKSAAPYVNRHRRSRTRQPQQQNPITTPVTGTRSKSVTSVAKALMALNDTTNDAGRMLLLPPTKHHHHPHYEGRSYCHPNTTDSCNDVLKTLPCTSNIAASRKGAA
jgi:hypothetical protein